MGLLLLSILFPRKESRKARGDVFLVGRGGVFLKLIPS